jgi:hypothetical protein
VVYSQFHSPLESVSISNSLFPPFSSLLLSTKEFEGHSEPHPCTYIAQITSEKGRNAKWKMEERKRRNRMRVWEREEVRKEVKK